MGGYSPHYSTKLGWLEVCGKCKGNRKRREKCRSCIQGSNGGIGFVKCKSTPPGKLHPKRLAASTVRSKLVIRAKEALANRTSNSSRSMSEAAQMKEAIEHQKALITIASSSLKDTKSCTKKKKGDRILCESSSPRSGSSSPRSSSAWIIGEKVRLRDRKTATVVGLSSVPGEIKVCYDDTREVVRIKPKHITRVSPLDEDFHEAMNQIGGSYIRRRLGHRSLVERLHEAEMNACA